MPSARKRKDLHPREGIRKPGNDRSERRWALVAHCEENGASEPANPFEIESKLLGIIGFVEKRRCVLDHLLAVFRRQLTPRPGSKRDGFYELFGAACMIADSDPLDYGSHSQLHLIQHRRVSRVVVEQRKQRRLVCDDAAEKLATLAGQPKRDRSTERVPYDPRWRNSQVLHQYGKVDDIFTNAALTGGTFALAVTAPIIDKNATRLGQPRNDQIPIMVRIPRPVHQQGSPPAI
jgi:hypothetical protein